jgi:hypothetical protein
MTTYSGNPENYIAKSSSRVKLCVEPRLTLFSGPCHLDRSTLRCVVTWLFILMVVSYAYFFNLNATTRMGLTLSIVERSQLTIDTFAGHTVDKAFYRGHYYADKAPGASLMAVPVVAATLNLFKVFRTPAVWFNDSNPTTQLIVLEYLVVIFTSCLLCATAIAALFLTSLRLGISWRGGLFAALCCGLGTPFWGWATAFANHGPSAALQFLALAEIIKLETAGPRSKVSTSRLLSAAVAGILLGWSCVVELIAVPSVLMIALYGLLRMRNWTPFRQVLQLAGVSVAASSVAIAPLLIYNFKAFGSVFDMGYSHVVGFEQMREGFFGVGVPSMQVVYEIILGEHRGILWLSPILAATPWALFHLFRHRSSLAILVTTISIYYLALNAGYAYWDGGWSTGPRHITPLLPFLCLPLALLWSEVGSRTRIALLTLLGASMIMSLISVTVGMEAHGPRMLWDYLFPGLQWGAWNGVAAFRFRLLPPALTLLPIFIFWGVMVLAWKLLLARSGTTVSSPERPPHAIR